MRSIFTICYFTGDKTEPTRPATAENESAKTDAKCLDKATLEKCKGWKEKHGNDWCDKPWAFRVCKSFCGNCKYMVDKCSKIYIKFMRKDQKGAMKPQSGSLMK